VKNNLAHRHRPTGLVNYSQDDVGQLLHDLTTLRAASTRMPVSVIRIRVVSIAPASPSKRSFLATTRPVLTRSIKTSAGMFSGREDSLGAALWMAGN
jgi:hypothetical protein